MEKEHPLEDHCVRSMSEKDISETGAVLEEVSQSEGRGNLEHNTS